MLKRFQDLLSIVSLTSLVFSFIVTARGNVETINRRSPGEAAETTPEKISPINYGKKPLLFEENKGQTDRRAKFIARGAGYTMYLTEQEAIFGFRISDFGFRNENGNPKTEEQSQKAESDFLKLKFVGANPKPALEGVDAAVTKTNYYIDNKRLENLANFQKARYANLYKGIDAVFYGNAANQLEYDFLVAPGIDADQIRLNFDGAKAVSIDAEGNLVVKTGGGELVQQKPIAYQEIDGQRKEIAVSYRIEDQSPKTKVRKIVSFSLGDYDRTKALVIDPALGYLSYLSGSGIDQTNAVAVDSLGNVYVTGGSRSLDFPNAVNPDEDGFVYVTKLSPGGDTILYNTFVSAFFGFAKDIVVDAGFNAYIGGSSRGHFVTSGTVQDEFPDRARGYNTCVFGTIGMVMKFSANGVLSFSTLLGGNCSDAVNGIAVSSNGRIYVAGATVSSDFPLKNQYQNNSLTVEDANAFLSVLNSVGSGFIYSTILKGRDDDIGRDVAVDAAGNAYVAGYTDSANFPTKAASQEEKSGGVDVFVTKINPNLSGTDSLVYSTFIGGGGSDVARSIASNAAGRVYLTGATGSFNYPLVKAFDTTNSINEAFITVLNPNATILASSFLGGNATEEGRSIALDSTEAIYIAGFTTSASDFRLEEPLQNALVGPMDGFVTKLRLGSTAFSILFSTYFGVSGNESCNSVAPRGVGEMWLACATDSADLPVTPNAIDATPGGDPDDGFLLRLIDRNADTVGVYNANALRFDLLNRFKGGAPDITVNRGAVGDVPVAGDFNGDTLDTVSTFNNGVWKIFNFNVVTGYSTGAITVNFGQPGDLPIVGDWNGDGIDTPGVFRPGALQFLLTNALPVNNSTPNTDITLNFGIGNDVPVAGDWNGDGLDSIGVFRPSANGFFLTDEFVPFPAVSQVFGFGLAGDFPIAGDWNSNGIDTVGVWRPSNQTFFLTNDHQTISNQFVFGQAGDQPVAGDWDGKP